MSGAEDSPSPRRRPGTGSGRGAFEPEAAPAKPRPRDLPSAPEEEDSGWSVGQILSAAVLVIFGIGLMGVFAIGMPLDLIGGKVVLAVPVFALIFLMRGRGRGRR